MSSPPSSSSSSSQDLAALYSLISGGEDKLLTQSAFQQVLRATLASTTSAHIKAVAVKDAHKHVQVSLFVQYFSNADDATQARLQRYAESLPRPAHWYANAPVPPREMTRRERGSVIEQLIQDAEQTLQSLSASIAATKGPSPPKPSLEPQVGRYPQPRCPGTIRSLCYSSRRTATRSLRLSLPPQTRHAATPPEGLVYLLTKLTKNTFIRAYQQISGNEGIVDLVSGLVRRAPSFELTENLVKTVARIRDRDLGRLILTQLLRYKAIPVAASCIYHAINNRAFHVATALLADETRPSVREGALGMALKLDIKRSDKDGLLMLNALFKDVKGATPV